MATPLLAGESTVNLDVLASLVNFLVDAGVKGLFIGGTTGEGILLGEKQRYLLHEKAIQTLDGRIPALIHVGANTTAESLRLAGHAQSVGAEAIVAVTPYYYPIHDDALFDHYQAIASAAANTPLLVYDIPHMAVNGVSPSLVERLATSLPSFAGWKSSNADARKVRSLIDATPDDKILLVGNESVALGNLALGADGLISGLSTAAPEPFVRMVTAFGSGNLTEARNYQKKINEMLNLLPPGARIGAIKRILQQRGIPVGEPIPPRPPAPADWPGWRRLATFI
jgi:dihydrodipicolinate synthase/N-acetylneuraminate lyase